MNKPTCLRLCLPWLLLAAAMPARADDDDARLLLDHTARQLQQYRQSGWLHDHTATSADDDAHISINGQTYRVGDSEAELAQGIYYALNLRQWDKVAQFTARYRQLPAHKPELVLLAEGLIARQNGDYATALRTLQAAAQHAPEDIRIQLELARLYTEDNQNREAAALFTQVLAADIPSQTRPIIEGYLKEIGKRRQWHGNISIGTGYNSNINQANGERQCTWQIDGQCALYRSLPQPVSSSVLNYSAVAAKTLPLQGHHNLQLRALVYGSRYHRKDAQNPIAPDYGNHTTALYGGYGYASAQTHWSIMPYFEHDYRNRQTHYRAQGADADWSRTLSPSWKINANLSGKHIDYSGANKVYFDNYKQFSAGIGVEHALSRRAGWFANIDAYRKKYPQATASSREYVARLGAYRLFDNGTYVNGMLLHRRSRHDAGSLMQAEGARRADRQTMLLLALGAQRLKFKGIYPELRWKHISNHSNSAFYRYRQNETTLNLRYHF